MFDFDSLREIGSTIGKNKMRTALTGIAVAWGIFMLIILLGAGNGLQNGITSSFSGRAQNSVTLWPGRTSIPYKGLPSDRRIRFDEKDYDLIRTEIPEVEYVSARVWQNATISFGEEYGAWDLNGVSDEIQFINNIKVLSGNGRFLNKLDIEERRKVVVISPEMKTILFKDKNALGEYVIANGIAFQVIGIYDTESADNNPPAYIPFSTAQMLYSGGYGFGRIDFTINGVYGEKENEAFIERLREKMGQLHTFDPTDRSALYIRNTAEQAEQANDILSAIKLFIWVIGIASLMAGIVGVGNIMLITVKERTKEIGIRKALGATPSSILRLIILEAIMITTVAGYIGIVLGVGLTEMISNALSSSGGNSRVFQDPTVDVGVVLLATLVLIVAGVSAGLLPALKATKVSPIEAMRAD